MRNPGLFFIYSVYHNEVERAQLSIDQKFFKSCLLKIKLYLHYLMFVFRFDYEERNRKKEAKEVAAYEAFVKSQQNEQSS